MEETQSDYQYLKKNKMNTYSWNLIWNEQRVYGTLCAMVWIEDEIYAKLTTIKPHGANIKQQYSQD